jgi:hypothetical protein
MIRPSRVLTLSTALVLIGSLFVALEATAQVRAEPDPARFDRKTGAVGIPIPDSQTAFPGTNCGLGDRGPTGSGVSVQIPFGTNRVVITQAVAGSSALCIFDGGTTIISAINTLPNFMTANTIVGNGEDDFLLVFDREVYAVGFTLLTNQSAHEVVTFKGVSGNVIDTINIDRFTPRNDRVFVGFMSKIPIKSILLDTADGSVQNEGFQAIKIAETMPGDLDTQ